MKIIKLLFIIYLVAFGFKTIVFAESFDCENWQDAKQDLQNVFNLLKIIVPLLVISLSTFDFVKAVASKEAKDVKKAFQTLIKRFALAVLFFFLPVILNFFLNMVEANSTVCIE